MKKTIILLFILAISIVSIKAKDNYSIKEKIDGRTYPSVFMAWYNIDNAKFPVKTENDRIKTCAKHDLMWEEPLSQKGEKVDLVLGLDWDNKFNGLATNFTKESLKRASKNKQKLLKYNPNIICLLEIRWRDAPMSFLPENSDWWLRDEKGEIKKGWSGGWEPFYLLDYKKKGLIDNIARQAKIAVESNVYDGIMLDWSGNLEVIKAIRKAIGKDKLIIVNIHDDIKDGELYKDYINGAFMELNPIDSKSMQVEGLKLYSKEDVNKRDWSNVEKALQYYESSFMSPQINCLEVWGNRKDVRRMRATTCMGLTMSDGYVLYADPNPLPTPDHLHDWYDLWDTNLGKPLEKGVCLGNGVWKREYEGGTAYYNPYKNKETKLKFTKKMKRCTTGETGIEFTIDNCDGDVFIEL